MLGLDSGQLLLATKDFAESMIQNLRPTVMSLLGSFLMIDLVLSFLFDDSEGMDIFMKLLKKILYYGFFIWIIQEYSSLIFETLMGGAIQLGNVASGQGSSTAIDTKLIEGFGIDASDIAALMAAGAGSVLLDIFGVEAMATVILMACVGYLMFFIMLYVQILTVFVKFYLVSGYAFLLMPFGVLSKTKDITLKALNGLFSQAIEIYVLVVILNLASKFQESMFRDVLKLPMNSLDAIKQNLFTKWAVLIFMFFLITKAGAIASSLMAGAIASIGIGAQAGANGWGNATSAPGKVASNMMSNASTREDARGKGFGKAFRSGSAMQGAYHNTAGAAQNAYRNAAASMKSLFKKK